MEWVIYLLVAVIAVAIGVASGYTIKHYQAKAIQERQHNEAELALIAAREQAQENRHFKAITFIYQLFSPTYIHYQKDKIKSFLEVVKNGIRVCSYAPA